MGVEVPDQIALNVTGFFPPLTKKKKRRRRGIKYRRRRKWNGDEAAFSPSAATTPFHHCVNREVNARANTACQSLIAKIMLRSFNSRNYSGSRTFISPAVNECSSW